jgi:hypothetical protein
MAWPRANIATLVVKFPKVLLLSEAEIQANGVKVRERITTWTVGCECQRSSFNTGRVGTHIRHIP